MYGQADWHLVFAYKSLVRHLNSPIIVHENSQFSSYSLAYNNPGHLNEYRNSNWGGTVHSLKTSYVCCCFHPRYLSTCCLQHRWTFQPAVCMTEMHPLADYMIDMCPLIAVFRIEMCPLNVFRIEM